MWRLACTRKTTTHSAPMKLKKLKGLTMRVDGHELLIW